MQIYFNIDDNNRLTGWSSTPEGFVHGIDIDEDHEIFTSDAMVFKYENGELIKDEAYQKQLIEEQENKISDEQMNAIALMELTEIIMGGK